MIDALFVMIAVIFFAASLGMVSVLQRLMEEQR